ncbi:hypothetical protein IWW50_004046 [Coemansia erecta]|nr:hypothetical protein IWW50_004046 [Coemansia erecta]
MMGMPVPPHMMGQQSMMGQQNMPMMGQPPQNPGFFMNTHHQQPWPMNGRDPASLSTTAVFVTGIPDTSLDEAAVRDFFGKFGSVQGVRIDYNKHTAHVEFGDPVAQTQALNTPEAVFNNRFVRVFRAHASAGPQTSEGGAPQPNQQQQQQQEFNQQQQQQAWKPKSAAIKKAEMIEKYVEQQKELMKKLTTTKDMPAATRKIIMDSIKQIQQKIDESRQPAKAAAPAAAEPQPAATDSEGSAQLDAVASEKAQLQSKLKSLQDEAARLGMAGTRGRGRGGRPAAAAWAAPRASMSLDKRPRTLVLRNVGQVAAEQLSSEMAQFGDIEEIGKLDETSSPPFTYSVKYRARWEAEKALKAVESLDLLSGVSADWE